MGANPCGRWVWNTPCKPSPTGVGSYKDNIYAWSTPTWAIQTPSGRINSLSLKTSKAASIMGALFQAVNDWLARNCPGVIPTSRLKNFTKLVGSSKLKSMAMA